jgi:hypothetical protein
MPRKNLADPNRDRRASTGIEIALICIVVSHEIDYACFSGDAPPLELTRGQQHGRLGDLYDE